MENVRRKLVLDSLRYFDFPVIFLSLDRFVIDINKPALDLYTWKRKDVVGKNLPDLLEKSNFEDPIPDGFPAIQKENFIKNILTTIKKKHEEITVQWKISLVEGENNIFQGMLLIGNDISLQIKLEDKNYELDSVIAQMPGNVYWYDRNYKYLGCNDNSARTLGISRQQAIGKDLRTLVTSLEDISQASINQMLQDGLDVMRSGVAKLNIVEGTYASADGKTVQGLANKVPLFDRKGKLYGVAGISMDITKQKETEEALRQAKEEAEAASRSKSDFLAGMSHDVKTPLAGMISYAGLLTPRVQPELQELTSGMMNAGKRLLSFFENCIELAKIENHSLVPSNENFSLKILVSDLVQLFRPAIVAKGLLLYIDYSEKIPNRLLGNRASLYRSLLNLIGNAIKFTPQGSLKIVVRLSRRSTKKTPMIQLKIIDTGMGIPEDKQLLIFEKFSRVESHQGSQEGHGIGLYIVQQFVESMGGQIDVKSVEGKGSQFTLAIPFERPLLADDEYDDEGDVDLNALQVLSHDAFNLLKKEPVAINGVFQETPVEFSGLRVLLVEDDRMAQRGAKTLLEDLDYQVDIADCGEKAIALFKPEKYSLVFVDLGLPDIKGYEVASRLRIIEKGTPFHVPIIGLSAHVSVEERALGADAGMDDMLSKPLLGDQTRELFERYVASKEVSLSE